LHLHDRLEVVQVLQVRLGLGDLVHQPIVSMLGEDLAVDRPPGSHARQVPVVRHQEGASEAQASRRSWHIGQTTSVEVRFLVDERTLQADALGLVAAKTRASLMVEGELPEDGLAALEGDNHDISLALAKRLTEPSGEDDPSREELFARVRPIAAEADGYLVDPDWVDETAAAGPGPGLPPVDIVNLWQSVFDGPTAGISDSEQTPPIVLP
jgi:hypothetical protein